MENKNYFGFFDVLRFAAALWVVITHYGFIGPVGGQTGYALTDNEPLALFFRMGYLGVPIFFVLSGFLIYYVSENRTPRDFGLNRLMRLMPAFWACVIFSFIVTSLFAGTATTPWLGVIANLTLMPQVFGYSYVDGVYWTLLYEFIFYFWFFLLLHKRTIFRYFYTICFVWLAISFANSLWLHNGLLERTYVTFYSGAFVAGMTLCRMRHNDEGIKPLFMLCCAVLALGFGIQRLHIIDNIPEQIDSMHYVVGLFYAMACIALVWLASLKDAPSPWHATFALLGAVSYPLYLLHQEAGYSVLQALGGKAPPLLAAIITALLAIVSAFLIHKLCEKPLQQMLKLIVSRLQQKRSGE